MSKTHCKRGHEFTEENTYLWKNTKVCRQCRRKNMVDYRTGHREERSQRSKDDHRAKKTQLVQYKGSKCMDCGGIFPECVYDFDHRDTFSKSFNIGAKIYKPIEELKLEADKCDLVCANCHRIRTANSLSVREKQSTGWAVKRAFKQFDAKPLSEFEKTAQESAMGLRQ